MKKLLTLAGLIASTLAAFAQGTAFTYNGRLNDGGNPANGTYDLRFALFDAAGGGSQQGGLLTNSPTAVSNGLFTVTLDFGNFFPGASRWLEIGVRTNVAGAFTNLIPRQQITSTPYAITAGNLSGALSSASLSGTYANAVTLNNGANSFSGNGAGLAALNASQLTSGTVPDARLSANVSLLGGSIESAEIIDGTIAPGDLNLTAFNPTFWRATGNAGTSPLNGNFIGTSDNQPLEFKVNGVRARRLEHSGRYGIFPSTTYESVNLTAGYWGNTIDGGGTVVGGTIAGGGLKSYFGGFFLLYPNTVNGDFGTVGGGYGNTAGNSATVPGGYNNSATGRGSFAAGRNAHTTNSDSFIWNDGLTSVNSSGVNCFDVYAHGGVNFFTSGQLDVRDTASPAGTIHVGANQTGGDPKLVKFGDGDYVHIGENGADDVMELKAKIFFFTHAVGQNGYVGIGTNNPQALLHVAGEARVNSLTITGGADVAEPFKMSSAAIPAGAVVIIDEENPGQLKMSERAYDRRVAGIVSGANGIKPGLSLSQQELNEGGQNVALSGRVYVLADVVNGAIKPGDLLTTSSTPGHAMKVTNYTKAQGSIIGKAMSSLKAGKSMVLVLVTLQ